jgi:hypothetical protein
VVGPVGIAAEEDPNEALTESMLQGIVDLGFLKETEDESFKERAAVLSLIEDLMFDSTV